MSPSPQMLPAIDVVGIILALTTTTILFPAAVNAQLDCSKAPTTALKIICEQLHRWDKNAREAPPVEEKIPLPPAIPGLPTPLIAGELAPVAATIYQCMDLGCLCSYMGGNGQQGSNACSLANGQPLRKALRREYRMLSDEERARFHAAMLAIKRSGEYNRIAAIHSQFATSGSAHSGPGFLPWHREFIKRFEIALRQVDPSVSLPYWDSTLDGALPTPGDSMLFTADFMGGSDGMGNLVTGGFGGWRTLTGRPNVLRRVGADGSCFREQDIQWFMNQNQIEMVFGFSAPQRGCTIPTNWNLLEYTHGNIHVFVGGDMVDQSTSANDPIFFIHHSFVDMIWEMWRLGRQSRNDREILYPMDMQLCAAPQHFGNARMRPFEPWNNIDGLSNKYTDNLYEYAPRPTCQAGPTCGSKYLFCDRSHGGARCAAKIRPGGNCMGFMNGEDVCMNGQCQGGRCVQTQQPVATTPRPIPVTPTSPLRPTTACYNEHECCSVWSTKGECQRNPKYMNAWCKASCRQCQPDYNLGDECSNRHPQCGQWSGQGECQRNQFWMTENCRQSCGRCQVTRAQVCSGGTGSQKNQNRVTVAPPRQNAKCTSPGCFNENICCQLWGLMGECRKNPGWMTCNCRVACGMCIPQDYSYGTCTDYHRQCRQWAMQGECHKNGWMLENCKQSCQTCVSFWELRQLCRGSRSGRRKRSTLEFSSIGFPPSIEADIDERPGRLLRDVEAAMALMGGGINATDRGINMDMQAPADGPAPPSGQSSSEKVQKLLQHQEELPESSGMPGGSSA